MVDAQTTANSNLTAADKIVGGAGTDTLFVTKTGTTAVNAFNGADVSGIEVVSVRNTDAGAVTVNATGLTAVNAVRGSGDVTATNLAQGASVGIDGTTNGTISATYAAAATSATLNVTNAATAGVVTLAGTGLTSVAINSTVGANTLGGVAVGAAVTAVTIDATSNINTGTITGVAANAAITVKGAGTANIGALVANVATVDASANLGGVTASLLNSPTSVKFTGGAGNDVITSNGLLLAAGASVNAGAGTADRLVLTTAIGVDQAAITTAEKASAALYTGFEELQVTGATQDVSIFTGSTINKLVVSGVAGVTGVSAAQAANIQAIASGTYTVGVTGAATVGQLDTVHITANDGVAANVSTIALTAPVLAGIETLQLTAVDNLTVSSLASAPALTSVKLDGAGTISLTTDAAHFAANSVIDASAATGAVTINASLAQAAVGDTGLAIKGGSGADTITGSVKADVLTGGAGNDTFAFVGGSVIGAAQDVITDFQAKTATAGDILTFGAGTVLLVADATALVAGVNVQQSAGGKITFAAADNNLALKIAAVQADTQLDAIGSTAFFEDSGNTYVYNAGTAIGNADDQLIQLTGVTGLTTLAVTAGNVTIAA